MGRKKNQKKSNRDAVPNKKKPMQIIALATLVVCILAGVYYVSKPGAPSKPVAKVDPFGPMIETRPILSPALFTGRAAMAYRYAAEIPKIIDSQFCYCYCKRDHGHKTLLTCFTNNHGAKCDTCIEEVIYAYELNKQGKSIDEIVIAIDKKFYRPYRPRRI